MKPHNPECGLGSMALIIKLNPFSWANYCVLKNKYKSESKILQYFGIFSLQQVQHMIKTVQTMGDTDYGWYYHVGWCADMYIASLLVSFESYTDKYATQSTLGVQTVEATIVVV